MIEVSATVTVGAGSEKHNHDVEYRQTLDHVHGSPDDVIELVPYDRSYEDQINNLMRPYIEEYNERQEEKYKAAWDRYNRGEIKSKPKRKDYKKAGFDYYKDHKDDTMKIPRNGKIENIPIYRSLIIGIGDMEDRAKISRETAERIFRKTLEDFQEKFPNFHVLGATMHADERGFWHMHLDFKPLYERGPEGKGLSVGIGLDSALERMGYKPEQSIINARDKAPILFNAMRNQIYYILEDAMAAERIRLQYGVSTKKDPEKNAGVNQELGSWQRTQDAVRDLQHNKNVIVDAFDRGAAAPEEVREIAQAMSNVANTVDKIQNSKEKRFDKSKRVVEFRLLDQLLSYWRIFVARIGELLRANQELRSENHHIKQKLADSVDRFEVDNERILHKAELADERQKVENLKNHMMAQGASEKDVEDIAVGGARMPTNRDNAHQR